MRTLLAILLLAFAVPARADIFEIALPELIGAYPSVRTVTFHLPGKPVVVRGALLRLVGTTEVGSVNCDPTVYPWPTETYSEMEQLRAESENGTVPGPFETLTPFTSLPPANPDWSFLLDGEGSFTLYGMPVISVCEVQSNPPTFTINGAWIRIDADIPVPAATTSWGSLKATYR